MNKKGFTLLELLSVVILLTLIVFLALPNITNMIKSYSHKTDEVVLKMIKEAAKLYADENKETITEDNYCISVKELVDKNYLKDNIEYKDRIINNTMSVLVTYNGGYNYDLVKNKYCNKVENGTPIYFDVAKGEGCTQDEYEDSYNEEIDDYLNSKIGYNGVDNKEETQNSCLKFYAFNDETENSTLNLLLDHNTTALVTWNSGKTNASGPNEVIMQLKIDTDNWLGTNTPKNYTVKQTGAGNYKIDYSKYKARLITANEIAEITGNEEFDEITSNYDADCYFDTNSDIQSETCIEGNTSGCKYGWLYDRIANYCKKYGCLNNNIDTETYGYWTGTSVLGGTYGAWLVHFHGRLDDFLVEYSGNIGVRPVIEVLKSKLN